MKRTEQDTTGVVAAQTSADQPASLPVLMLTILGTLIAVLGLFAAGEIGMVIVGLVSLIGAGLLDAFTQSR